MALYAAPDLSHSPRMGQSDLSGETLLLLLRAQQPQARDRVIDELRAQGGHVLATAKALGVSPRSLYRAAERDAELGRRFRALTQGLDGSRRAALEARGVAVEKPKRRRK